MEQRRNGPNSYYLGKFDTSVAYIHMIMLVILDSDRATFILQSMLFLLAFDTTAHYANQHDILTVTKPRSTGQVGDDLTVLRYFSQRVIKGIHDDDCTQDILVGVYWACRGQQRRYTLCYGGERHST